MQCKQINNIMMKYFDGIISEPELLQLLKHNQKCPECKEEFELLKDAINEIETLPDINPPVELTVKIMAAVAEQKHYKLSAGQLICGIIGFVGLVFFTYNIISYVIFPMIGIEPLVSFQSLQEVIYMLIVRAKDGFVALSLYLGKLLVFRNTLFKEHIIFISLWMVMFAIAGLLLYRAAKNKNNYADLS